MVCTGRSAVYHVWSHSPEGPLRLRRWLPKPGVRHGSQGPPYQPTQGSPLRHAQAFCSSNAPPPPRNTNCSSLSAVRNLATGNRPSYSDACSNFYEIRQTLLPFYVNFLQCLPANVRMVLVSTDSSVDISKLAELADKVMEVATPTIANLSDPALTATGISSSEVKLLREDVSCLTGLVESLTTRSRPRSLSRLPRRVSSPSPPQSSHESLCWYHCQYGDHAQKCREPCARGLKHSGQSLVVKCIRPVSSHLFYITDQNTGTRFLVDTGAEVSIIPPSPLDRKHSPDTSHTANAG